MVVRISGRFILTTSVGRRRIVTYISLVSATIPENYIQRILVNYSSEFEGFFQTIMYKYSNIIANIYRKINNHRQIYKYMWNWQINKMKQLKIKYAFKPINYLRINA